MENCTFIVDLPIENGGSFHSYVSLPEGILYNIYIPHLRTSPAPAEFDHLQVLRPETCVSIDFPSKTEGTNMTNK